jgi:membrane protease YdiL (CAAX protease family)
VVAAPIGEELLFRGLLYRSLRNRMGIALAVGLSAAVFGVMHWWFGDPAVLIFPRVALGVLLALLYEGTGSLYPSMLLHAWVNMGLATALFPELRGALGLALLAGAVVAVCVSVRDPRRKKHQRPPAAPEPPRFARTPLDAPESMRRVAAGQ